MANADSPRLLVVGLGNPVRGDDSVGLCVAREVRRCLGASTSVEVEELWAGGLRLAEMMSGFDRAVVVDAMTTQRHRPGTVRTLTLEDLGGLRTITCLHDTTLPTALGLLRDAGEPVPGEIAVIGIEAEDIDSFSETLTAAVAGAVPEAVDAVLAALGNPTGSAK